MINTSTGFGITFGTLNWGISHIPFFAIGKEEGKRPAALSNEGGKVVKRGESFEILTNDGRMAGLPNARLLS